MKSATEAEIERIRQNVETATKQLAELEAKLKAEREAKSRYSPSKGQWMIPVRFDQRVYSREAYATQVPLSDPALWRSFPSSAAAEAALAHQRHFARLLKLASDVNPNQKPGGRYGVCYVTGSFPPKWLPSEHPNSDCASSLFMNFDAASKAAEILNRDGWRPPICDPQQGFGPLARTY